MGPLPRTLVVACGALGREITALIRLYGWNHMSVSCLPAKLHNHPQRIPGALRDKIRAERGGYDRVVVAYGDCGTGGQLDAVLAEEGVERIPGPHCYAFYAGEDAFEALMDEEVGSFFLTDYLVRHFDRLIVRGLGLDRYPQLLPDYFGHYQRLVHLAQVGDPALDKAAKEAAMRLGLTYERRLVGFGGLESFLRRNAEVHSGDGADQRRVLA